MRSILNSTGVNSKTHKPAPISVDERIRTEILRLTSENSDVWSSPDHNRREYVHSFFQYPAMMVPIVQKRIIDIIKKEKPETNKVIDPFMGSATSLVACMQNGLDCYGQDINPLAILIGDTRTGPYYVKAIRSSFKRIKAQINKDKSLAIETKFSGRKKWFKEIVARELSKIVRAIRLEPRLAIRKFYWINLAETIRLTSNDRTSTFKLHARPLEEIAKRDISPIQVFTSKTEENLNDLLCYQQLLKGAGQLSKSAYKNDIKISLFDSSKKIICPNDKYFDLLVTSPPYGDNKTTVTYGQHSYLPLQWIDLKDIRKNIDKNILKTTLEIDSRSLGGKFTKMDSNRLEFLFSKSATFNDTYLRLKKIAPDRVDKVLVFVNDLYKVLENVFKVMKVNAYQVWTIGNRCVGGIEIPNSVILKEFILANGGVLVTQIEREILNKRMAKWNKNSTLMNTEDILIFRK